MKMSRAKLLIGGLFLVLVVIVGRLFYIQVIQHDRYTAEADAMQITKNTIKAERGQIYVRDGQGGLAPMVLNEPVYTVFADPTQVTDTEAIKVKIDEVAGGEAIRESYELLSDRSRQYVVLARQVTRTQAEKIKSADLAGVGLQAGTRRVYPEGSLAAQTLGFVNVEGEGQYGIEQFLNEELSGTPGVLQSVTDVRRIPLTIGQHDVRTPAVNGTDIVLTIDRNIQAQAETILQSGLKRVNATKGSIVVIDPQNGQIRAMANFPTFDPANFTKVTDAADFTNRVVDDAFEPGSVIKALTMGVALDAGVVTPDTTFLNRGCTQVEDANICNVERGVDNTNVSMSTVLQLSLNTGMIFALQQMGGGSINSTAKNVLYNYFTERYHMGQRTGVEVAGEAAGTIISPNDAEGGSVRYANMTFGQGMNVSMLQVAAAFASAINGGTYYQPTIIDGTLERDGSETARQPQVVSENVLHPVASEQLKTMLFEGRYKNGGNILDRGYYVGAKSGTAQWYDPSIGGYSTTQFIGTYLGYGADANHVPKYVIMVRVDDAKVGGGATAGSAAAGPIFTEMSNWIVDYEGISK